MSFKKTMKMLAIQLIVVTIIFGVVYLKDAEAQQGMRQWLCDIFKCQDFIDLAEIVLAIKQDTEQILTNQTITTTNQETMLTNQGTMDGKLESIQAEFPITVEPDPATAEALARIEKKLDYFAKSEQSIWLEPMEGMAPGFIEVLIYIRGESLREITAFGLDLTFDSAILQYQAIAKGRLTQNWALLNANEITPGTLRIGGVLGLPPPIVGDVIGEIAVISFEIIGTAATTQLCVTNMVDALANYSPSPGCVDYQIQQ